MSIVLGANRYGKAETRVFRIVRDTDRHVIRDLNVSTSLTGDFAAAHLAGDQAHVLPVTGAEVRIEEHGWERIADHDHSFRKVGPEVRTTRVVVAPEGTSVVS